MKNNLHFAPRGDDTGNVDAGDASASLYNINEDNIDPTANSERTGITPGQNVEDLRGAMHGDPEADLDGDAGDATRTNSGNAGRADGTSV